MNKQPIGIIDSGFGGLWIWQEIIKQMPFESTIYFADSLHCPYGNREASQIYQFAKSMIAFLLEQHVKLVVIACNTITVTNLAKLRDTFPQMPIIGIVPVIKTAARLTKNKHIGVLSTCTTAASDYQKQLIAEWAKDCTAVNLGTDQLVPLIEKGKIERQELQPILEKVLQPFQEAEVDVIALGCSHFPFIKDAIQEIVGSDVLLIDSAGAVARQTKRILESKNAQAEESHQVSHAVYTTGEKAQFAEIASLLLPQHKTILQKVEHQKLDKV